MNIQDQGCIVTGGTSGIGLNIVLNLLQRGARVAFWGRNKKQGLKIQNQYPETSAFIECEVSDMEQVSKAFDQSIEKIGNASILVNSAGISPREFTIGKNQIHDLQSFWKTFDINLTASFNTSRLIASHLVQQKRGGVIINISSIVGQYGTKGNIAYAASKSAMNSMTLPMARDLGRYGIRVVTIAPGAIQTPMTEFLQTHKELINKNIPLNRLGVVQNVYDLVEECICNGYLNGKVIEIDGGYIPFL